MTIKRVKVLITGATGFVGKHLCEHLVEKGFRVRGTHLAWEGLNELNQKVEPIEIDPISPDTNWDLALAEINTVIHLAARVHVMSDTSTNPLAEFRKVNCAGTINLALKAARAGVKRFVFMSTIGVNGDNSGNGSFLESDQPRPHNPYSVSKHEAELALWEISKETGMELVVIRAPLVYGPRNPGNFLSLLRIVSKGVPLPFASINNCRSLIYVGNLVDALSTIVIHPEASGKTYLVSDGEDVSTPELIRLTARSLGVRARLIIFPLFLMKIAGLLTSKSGAVKQLTGSLTVDSSKIKHELGWVPPFTLSEGLMETATWFLRRGK